MYVSKKEIELITNLGSVIRELYETEHLLITRDQLKTLYNQTNDLYGKMVKNQIKQEDQKRKRSKFYTPTFGDQKEHHLNINTKFILRPLKDDLPF